MENLEKKKDKKIVKNRIFPALKNLLPKINAEKYKTVNENGDKEVQNFGNKLTSVSFKEEALANTKRNACFF